MDSILIEYQLIYRCFVQNVLHSRVICRFLSVMQFARYIRIVLAVDVPICRCFHTGFGSIRDGVVQKLMSRTFGYVILRDVIVIFACCDRFCDRIIQIGFLVGVL